MPMSSTHTSVSVKKNFPIFMVCVGLFVFFQLPALNSRLLEDRWYRDIVGVTPFDSVTLHSSTIVDDGIILGGEMRKVRCEYESLTGYVTFEDKPRQRVIIDDSEEGFVGSRPPSEFTELWGPWQVVWYGDQTPTGWEIHANHVKCPSEPVDQVNLFLEGSWDNFLLPED